MRTLPFALLTLFALPACTPNPCGWTLYPDEYLGDARFNLDNPDFGVCAESSVEDDHEIEMTEAGSYSFRVMANEPLVVDHMPVMRTSQLTCTPFVVDLGNDCVDVGYSCTSDGRGSGARLERIGVDTAETNVAVINVFFSSPD